MSITEVLHNELLKRKVLHADETTVEVLNKPGKKAETDSYMCRIIQEMMAKILLSCMIINLLEVGKMLLTTLKDMFILTAMLATKSNRN